MKTWLLDAGPIIALADSRDPSHEAAAGVMGPFRGRLITTGAVLVEAFHLVRRYPRGPDHLLEFLEMSGTTTVECCQRDSLRAALALMNKYADTPMDFADATLVLLADHVGAYDICTLDRRGFQTFRTAKGKRFRLALDGG